MLKGCNIREFAAALMVAATFLSSCRKADEPEISVSIKAMSASGSASSQFVSVKAAGDWTIRVITDAEGDEVGWAWFNEWNSDENVVSLQGNGNLSSIQLYWAKNLSDKERTCQIELTCQGSIASCTFTQGKGSQQPVVPSVLVSDPVPSWMELPAMNAGEDLFYFNHMMPSGGSQVRNYSFLWNKSALVAHWVAYPLNSKLIGSGGRTNAWGVDPKLPIQYQPVLYSGFRGGYQRGHQLPSADRLVSGANEATFYSTNMTPQKGELNEQAWATLEGMVRDWSRSFDTLYVVTGCDIHGSVEVAYDNMGKAVKVPVGYYKALLGYKKGGTVANTGKTGGYAGVAFYMNHEAYKNNRSTVLSCKCTIQDLEQRLHQDFFVNLPNVIGTDKSRTVETTIDEFWK